VVLEVFDSSPLNHLYRFVSLQLWEVVPTSTRGLFSETPDTYRETVQRLEVLLYPNGGLRNRSSSAPFAPIIFEKLSHVGGIWPVHSDDQANIVPPDMPTNVSKHIVTFSDLAWDSVRVHENKQPGQDIATFPKAHQVGKYLQTYTRRYISPPTQSNLAERL
jgi:hypothetical protein